jgi:hypothetical protein
MVGKRFYGMDELRERHATLSGSLPTPLPADWRFIDLRLPEARTALPSFRAGLRGLFLVCEEHRKLLRTGVSGRPAVRVRQGAMW